MLAPAVMADDCSFNILLAMSAKGEYHIFWGKHGSESSFFFEESGVPLHTSK